MEDEKVTAWVTKYALIKGIMQEGRKIAALTKKIKNLENLKFE